MRQSRQRLTVTVSGSFSKAMLEIQLVVRTFTDNAAIVLSPADPQVVAADGEFVFVASDRLRDIRLVQQRHMSCIAASDLLWLVCPEGYVGASAAMEIGFAAAHHVPIYATDMPTNATLRAWVTQVPSPVAALQAAQAAGLERGHFDALVDPEAAIALGHIHLEQLRGGLLAPADPAHPGQALDAAAHLGNLVRDITDH